MALIKCEECKKEVSSKASNCPHCGIKVRKQKGCVFILSIICAIAIFIFANSLLNDTINSKPAKTSKDNSNNQKVPSTGGTEVITVARAIGCPTINAYEKYLDIAQSGDGAAILQVAADLNCRMMNRGDKVKVLEWKMLKNLVKVHPEGNSMTFWLANEFVSTNNSNSKKKSHHGDSLFLELEPFVVKLADSPEYRYVKLKIAIEFASIIQSKNSTHLTPKFKFQVTNKLASLRTRDLMTAKGKTKLKDELLIISKDIFSPSQVEGVYFLELIVQ